MKLVDLKKHIGAQLWYRSLDPSKKRRQLYLVVVMYRKLMTNKDYTCQNIFKQFIDQRRKYYFRG